MESKIELIEKAIDSLFNLTEIEGFDTHFFLNSENSVVNKLRSLIYKIEEE